MKQNTFILDNLIMKRFHKNSIEIILGNVNFLIKMTEDQMMKLKILARPFEPEEEMFWI